MNAPITHTKIWRGGCLQGRGCAPEGRAGELKLLTRYVRHAADPDLSDVLAHRAAERPWLLQLWEPLHTKAPAPPKAQPFCCYINTVIFYHFPYIIAPWGHPWKSRSRWHFEKAGGRFIQWDQIESRFTWDDRVEFEGDIFEVQGGEVLWRKRRWWMRRSARRVNLRGG